MKKIAINLPLSAWCLRVAFLACLCVLALRPTYADIIISGNNYNDQTGYDPSFWTNGGSSSVDAYTAYDSYSTSTLLINNGSDLETYRVRIGQGDGSTAWATVSGPGSTWNAYSLTAGYFGNATFRIENGGVVEDEYGYVGLTHNSVATATVTGAGSQWNNNTYLYLGFFGNANGTLNIEDGGQVTSPEAYVGYQDVEGSGTVNISGSGSQWTNTGTVFIGHRGTGNITVSNGGVLDTGRAFLSRYEGSGHVTVTDAGSTWNAENILVGTGNAASLTISNGGQVNSAEGRVGAGSMATITGDGSTWAIATDFYAGFASQGDVLVEDGGTLSNNNGLLGRYAGASGNMTVTGSGSEWNNTGLLYVGHEGAGDLAILNGGKVTNVHSYVARYEDSFGAVSVTGANSQWINSGTLSLGHLGTGTLDIMDGGIVSNTTGALGAEAGGDGTATVSGNGSRWDHSLSFYVGYGGDGDLTVSDGGTVTSKSGLIGHYETANGNAKLTGPGSKWEVEGDMVVGVDGIGALSVRDGATVSNHHGYLGYYAGSSGTATVSGPGSSWTSSGNLNVGLLGNGTLNIANGGYASAEGEVNLSPNALANLHVSNTPGQGTDGALLESTGSELTNNGTIMFYASGGLEGGTYTVLEAAGGVFNNGTIAGVGGAVNADYSFTVSEITTGQQLEMADMALQRYQFTGFEDLVLAFDSGATNVTFGVEALDMQRLDEEYVLGAYDFTDTSVALGDQVLVSMQIGGQQDINDLSIWHSEDGLNWSLFNPDTMSYDEEGWINFTVSGFSSYAVTSLVPEPASGLLLAVAVISILLRRRKA